MPLSAKTKIHATNFLIHLYYLFNDCTFLNVFPAIIHTLLPFYLQEVSIIAFTWDNYKRSITKGDLVQSTAIRK